MPGLPVGRSHKLQHHRSGETAVCLASGSLNLDDQWWWDKSSWMRKWFKVWCTVGESVCQLENVTLPTNQLGIVPHQATSDFVKEINEDETCSQRAALRCCWHLIYRWDTLRLTLVNHTRTRTHVHLLPHSDLPNQVLLIWVSWKK